MPPHSGRITGSARPRFDALVSWLCTKSPCSGISLCNLSVLCVSVVWFYSEFINHRDTEDTEVAQRRERSRLFVQSPSLFNVNLVESEKPYDDV